MATSSRTLIKRSGLAGVRKGGAEVSKLHANFIVCNPGATSADVLQLIEYVQEEVLRRMGVQLEPEIDIW